MRRKRNNLNIIVPVESTRSKVIKYTAQGLGDRVHLLTIAWAAANKWNQDVTLHLSADKNTPKKRRSFDELLTLFPCNAIRLQFHEYHPSSNVDFEEYLRSVGVTGDTFFYGDHMGWNERRKGIDVSLLLSEIPLIKPFDDNFPRRIVTTQWDTTGEMRKFTPAEIQEILDSYRREGYEVITIGGEASETKYRDSLFEIGQLLSQAKYHVGVDSGFMHFAQIFLPPHRIHVYSKSTNFWSHHLFRGIENGMVLNYHFEKYSFLQLKKIQWRYDSPLLLRIWHSSKRFLNLDK